MASATDFAAFQASKNPTSALRNAPTHQPSTVADWACVLTSQLSLVLKYTNADEVPSSISINEVILDAPRRRAADPTAATLAQDIADAMYPSYVGINGPIAQYEKDLIKLRQLVTIQRKRTIEDNTRRKELMSWNPRILKQGPWDSMKDPSSLIGAPSLPMPVEIAEPEVLAPFFQHLALGGNDQRSSTIHGESDGLEIKEPYYDTAAIEFERGVSYSDGRMDLCKMVVGPNNIDALMESLRTNNFITHFLLGNNIIGPYGAKCIANFVKEFPDRMDTWYLARNCIDAPSLTIPVDQWTRSTSTTNIWLKRNALGPSAADDIFRLVTETTNLRTLDLDQTELGDAGVVQLFNRLAKHDKPVALRHLYMSAIGIGVKGSAAIGDYLTTPHCRLESLYLTNNPMGDEGAKALAQGLKSNRSLTRLAIGSIGLNDAGIIALCEALDGNSSITMLNIGQSYSTEDLGSRYNYITDRSAYALHNLLLSASNLAYLDLNHCAMTHLGLNTMLEALLTSPSILFFRATTIHPQTRDPASIHLGQQHSKLNTQAQAVLLTNVQRIYGQDVTYDKFMTEHKRWLVSDKQDVRKIDSVYRNRDAGMARRGLKKLNKWWDEGDETLQKVAGAVGPVCTMRKKKATAAVNA